MHTDNNKGDKIHIYQESNTIHLLDGIIEQRRDLGKLGREIEYLLRIGGVTATIDPKPSNQRH